jgi:hypothetical protein
LATHSPEIISDVPFQNVVVVQKREPVSKAAQNADAIQDSLRKMGSIHNIQLSKLASRGILLFVEGDDRPFLGEVAYKLGSSYFDNFSDIAVQEIDGAGNWQRALGASRALKLASSGEISVILLLDSDYFSEESQESKTSKGLEHSLKVKFWVRKEIENYFVIPAAIARYVNDRSTLNHVYSVSEVEQIVADCAEQLRADMIECVADDIRLVTKSLAVPSAMARSRERVSKLEAEGMPLTSLVSGKKLFSCLSRCFQERAGVSFSALAICKEVTKTEVPSEMTDFVVEVCRRRSA